MKLLLITILIFIGYSSFSQNSSAPILILSEEQNFGNYTAEILKAEGFNEFDLLSLDHLSFKKLNHYSLVILPEIKLTSAQRSLLSHYVHSGGNLIAFRPDSLLAPLFGLIYTGQILQEGYIRIDTTHQTGKGLISETIQYHGAANLYRIVDGEKVASLYENASTSTSFPAMILHHEGKGKTAAFAYNLPKSIVYMRQGNPEWAGEERDKVDGPTATDLFYPLKGQKQWNDPTKVAIPQADEQMHLLTHVMETMSSDQFPLPRLWYFPDQLKSIFIFTIDGEDSKESDIDSEIQDVQSKNGNVTLFEIGTYIHQSTVQKWRSSGNEVAIHFNDVPNYLNPTFTNMKTVIDTMTSNFRKAYGYLPKTTRNHWVVWVSKDSTGKKEFAQQAALEASFGIGFDCNYYQFGGNKVYPNWMGDVGHITGSGIPMKFADSKGKILDIYQSNTQLADETWLKDNIENKSKLLINRSLDMGYYAWINANYHTWYWKETREAGLKVLDYCKLRGIPVWTAEKSYEFLKMKDEASFSDLNWSKNELSFILHSSINNPNGLTITLPSSFKGHHLKSVSADQKELPFNLMNVKGVSYAFSRVSSGKTTNISAHYGD